MDTTFLKLIDGARVKNHMGLRLDEGVEAVKGKNYLHLDIPVRISALEDTTIKRGQHLFIPAAGTVNVKGRNIVEVEGNPTLAEYGQLQPSYRIHPDSGEKQLGIHFTAHKQVDVSQLEYCVRLYMYV